MSTKVSSLIYQKVIVNVVVRFKVPIQEISSFTIPAGLESGNDAKYEIEEFGENFNDFNVLFDSIDNSFVDL